MEQIVSTWMETIVVVLVIFHRLLFTLFFISFCILVLNIILGVTEFLHPNIGFT